MISAWADTLASVPSEQGASEINFDLPTYVLAASLVRGAGDWSDKNFRRLLTHLALPLSHGARRNNHGNWGVLLEATIGAYVGDSDVLTKARTRWLVLMARQIDADGSLPLEICRSDTNDYCGGAHQGINGLSYTHYTLLPATAAARVFELQGLSVCRRRKATSLLQPTVKPRHGPCTLSDSLSMRQRWPLERSAQCCVLRAAAASVPERRRR